MTLQGLARLQSRQLLFTAIEESLGRLRKEELGIWEIVFKPDSQWGYAKQACIKFGLFR